MSSFSKELQVRIVCVVRVDFVGDFSVYLSSETRRCVKRSALPSIEGSQTDYQRRNALAVLAQLLD